MPKESRGSRTKAAAVFAARVEYEPVKEILRPEQDGGTAPGGDQPRYATSATSATKPGPSSVV